jgi:hypothetical protein
LGFNPDAEELISKDLPSEKGPMVKMTTNVHSDHIYDLVTRRFIIGDLIMINNTPIRWTSEHQKAMKTSAMLRFSVIKDCYQDDIRKHLVSFDYFRPFKS